MAHLILTGATGLVGSAALQHMLPLTNNGAISKLSILSRREVPMATGYSNVNTIIVKDFAKLSPEILSDLKGATGCVWALGISQFSVTKEEYIKITVDYPMEAAHEFSKLSDHLRFIYVSGEGATAEPGMFTQSFGRIKGEVEQKLLKLAASTESLEVINVRPGGVDPGKQPELEAGRVKSTYTKVLESAFLPAFRVIAPGFLVPTQLLGKYLTDLALDHSNKPTGKGVLQDGGIVTNAGMLRLAK